MPPSDEQSSFDPDSYLDAQITEPSIRRPPFQAGSEWIGTVKDLKIAPWVKKDDPSKKGVRADVHIELDPSSNPSAANGNAAPVTLVDGVMLNTTETGAIDNSPGKNARLRQYRDALNMNNPGEPFTFRNMIGRSIRVTIKHEPYQGEMYDKINSVARP